MLIRALLTTVFCACNTPDGSKDGSTDLPDVDGTVNGTETADSGSEETTEEGCDGSGCG